MRLTLTYLITINILVWCFVGTSHLHKFLFPLMPEGGQMVLSLISASAFGLVCVRIMRIPIRKITEWST